MLHYFIGVLRGRGGHCYIVFSTKLQYYQVNILTGIESMKTTKLIAVVKVI